MTLYEIEESIAKLVDAETGEITDAEAFDALQIERDEKIENIACYIKNLDAENTAIKTEVDNLNDRAKTNKNKIERLKALLSYALQGEKFKTAKCVVSYRKSTKVEVDEEFLNWAQANGRDDLLTYKAPEISKTAIKDAIENGCEFEHAHLVENNSVTIK